MSSGLGSYLFKDVPITGLHAARAPSKKLAPTGGHRLKKFPRTRDMRPMVASRHRVTAVAKPEPLGITRRSSTTRAGGPERSRPDGSKPTAHNFEGGLYMARRGWEFLRLGANQNAHPTMAIQDVYGTMTSGQIALHALAHGLFGVADGVLESALARDITLVGHSLGGLIVEEVVAMLTMSCGSPRAIVYLDSRIQTPTPLVDTMTTEYWAVWRAFGGHDGVINTWKAVDIRNFRQSSRRFRSPASQLEVLISPEHGTWLGGKLAHPDAEAVLKRLALMSKDAEVVYLGGGGDHFALMQANNLDIVSKIRREQAGGIG